LTNLDEWAVQRDFKVPLLFGAIAYRLDPERTDGFAFYNTAFLIDENGMVLGAYDKTYLLMFGEYLPLVHYWRALEEKIRKILPEAGDFVPGKTVEVIPYKGVKIGVMICYEDIIPAFTRKLAGKDPNIIINITNDAWFGKTAEPYLHLALAVFRAIENRVALIRSTNTGVSAFIDPVGRIYAQTDLDNAETVARDVPLLESKTIYRYLGDYFGYMNVAAGVLFLGYGFTRSRGKGSKKKKSKSSRKIRKDKKPGDSPAKATVQAKKSRSTHVAAESGKRSSPRKDG
jgi:apolipoprotein N-acyltransferase